MPAEMKLLIAAHVCAAALAATLPAFAAEPPRLAPMTQITIDRDDLGADDFALRYYASLDQAARVKAEIARLQRLYPTFEPPADLYSAAVGAGAGEEALWELFAADRLDELRAAMTARQEDMPDWRPSADLLQKLQRKELRNKILAYWRDGRWQDLVAFARDERYSALDGDVDSLWTIAEAFARARKTPDAFAIYKSILNSAKDRQIRLATIQKAMASLRMADVEALLAMGVKGPDGASEFRAIAADVTRARIAAFLRDERPDDIARADLAQFEAHARDGRDPEQLGLIAWYHYKRRDFHGALEWFKLAIQYGGDPMIAHGLAHTLRALDMRREAEEVAFAWREPLVNNMILFLDILERDLTRETPPYIEPERLARYARVTMETASGEGAQALAWYAYNSCQFDVALTWFEKAVAWFPKEATVYGYGLALKRAKNDKAVVALVNRYDGLFPKVVELLFPDGVARPRSPCDQRDSAKLHGAAVKMGAYVVPGPADPARAEGYDRGYAYRDADAVAAQGQPAANLRRDQISKALKGRFPIAVSPENPLRFRPLTVAAARPFAASPPLAAAVAPRPDPARGARPLVARRVPGVGPMPYERYGFSLLPGWNGIETATWPPASEQIAPAGTQWASSDADPARAARQGYEAGYRAAATYRSVGFSTRGAPAPLTRYGAPPMVRPAAGNPASR